MKTFKQLKNVANKRGLKIAATTFGRYAIHQQEQKYPFRLLTILNDITLEEVNEYFGTK